MLSLKSHKCIHVLFEHPHYNSEIDSPELNTESACPSPGLDITLSVSHFLVVYMLSPRLAWLAKIVWRIQGKLCDRNKELFCPLFDVVVIQYVIIVCVQL